MENVFQISKNKMREKNGTLMRSRKVWKNYVNMNMKTQSQKRDT